MKLTSKLALSVFSALALVSIASAATETYAIDPAHSSVGFSIRHLVGRVTGSFTKFQGTLQVDRENPAANSVEATIDAASINTANDKRDNHLRSPDFFDVAKFTTLTFKSTAWKKTGEDTYEVTGDLTIHGVTKSVVLAVTSTGFGPGMMPGMQVSGWEATIKLNRRDFGVNGPAMLGKAVGDEVTVTIAVEADLKK